MMRFPTYQVVDGFAGPGGWSLACARLGLKEMGIETDKAAHMTRRAAGFHTIRASVADLGPANFPNAVGKIDSPPCQTFSMAGKGAGRKALDTVLAAVDGMAHGIRYPLTEWEDPRTGLVLEPLRWHLEAHALGKPYRWIALEQVPTVLPVWHAYAEVLENLGYSVAVGNLHAEQYGVPQTRKRAILIASLDRQVTLPTPTHSRYHTRSPQRLDPDVLPWVSMANALGWEGFTQEAQQGMGMLARAGRHERPRREDDQPSFTITGADGGGSARLRMISNYGTGGDPAARGERTSSQPAPTVTGKIDRNRWQLTSGTRPNAATRAADEPAPALAFGHDSASYAWAPEGMTPAELVEWKRSGAVARFGNQDHSAERSPDQPAATIRYSERASALDWVHQRPTTTVVGSFSPETIAAPGYRVSEADGSRQNAPGSVRVSVQEAGILQSFPWAYPWQGSKTKQYQQVGNAIPPLLAEAVLRAVI